MALFFTFVIVAIISVGFAVKRISKPGVSQDLRSGVILHYIKYIGVISFIFINFLIVLALRYWFKIDTETKYFIYFVSCLICGFKGGAIALIRLSEPIVFGTFRKYCCCKKVRERGMAAIEKESL